MAKIHSIKKALLARCTLSVLAAASCKKDDKDNNSNNSGPSKGAAMSCKIDGTLWESNLPATYVVAGGRHQLGFTKSANGSYETFILDLDDSAPGTYNIGSSGTNTILYTLVASSSFYLSQSGTVTITQYDAGSKRLEGNFSGTLEFNGATKNITEGTFAYNYQ